MQFMRPLTTFYTEVIQCLRRNFSSKTSPRFLYFDDKYLKD